MDNKGIECAAVYRIQLAEERDRGHGYGSVLFGFQNKREMA
jgi:hypothetical protein